MKRKWYRLDNAALIFPAIIRKNWNNVFRVSATLEEDVEPELLNRAIREMTQRFPTYFVRLRAGFFWYYLEETDEAVTARPDYAYPLTHMTRRELRRCCLRVLYYQNRIAVEIFHSVTDGTGGLIFLKNLAARYLELKYGEEYPHEAGVVDLTEESGAGERQDCFLQCGAEGTVGRAEPNAYRLSGEEETDGFRHITTGIVPTDVLLDKAHEQGATVTAYLAAVMGEAVADKQAEDGGTGRLARPVKITIPVNLRKVFGLETFRNFTLAVNIGFDPRLGEYSHEQVCRLMHHQLAAEVIPQRMAGRVTTNVRLQKNLLLRLMPLAVKRTAMRLVYAASGESKGCLNISNMGVVTLPTGMRERVKRFDFVIGVQYSYPNNCSVVSWQGKTYISMIRNIREAELERLFFSRLVELGIPVEIESNQR